jgi:hypothetical protein
LARILHLFLCAATAVSTAYSADWMARAAAHADRFAERAPHVFSRETLVQRSFQLPPHRRFAIGAAAEPVAARYFVHELISEYAVGPIKGDGSGNLYEFREILAADGTLVQAREAARKELFGPGHGEEQIRKKALTQFLKFGLVDVASDYSLILMAFTKRGQETLQVEEAGAELVGVDEAIVFRWRQTIGGAREFQRRKTARRLLSGSIWIRKADAVPLRISAQFEHRESNRVIHDDASVEYETSSTLGCVTPVSVVHRHSIDGVVLTENLFTYDKFHVFTTDSRIEFIRPETKR